MRYSSQGFIQHPSFRRGGGEVSTSSWASDQSLPTMKNAYLSEGEEFVESERTGFDEL
jgi:hypothetical protein